ncbi:MAG: ATP-binding protein [Bacteroidota bacterium]
MTFKSEQAAFLDELAKIYQMQGKYDRAISKLEESLALFTQIDKLTDKAAILKTLSENYELKGDIETSHRYLKQYNEEREILITQSNNEQMENLETVIEVQRKQQQLDKLQEQNRIARTRFYGYSLLFGLLVLILISWLLYARYRTQARANEMLTEKNQKIEEQNARLLEANADLGQFAEIAAQDLTTPLNRLKELTAKDPADTPLSSTTAQLEDLVTGLSLYAVLSEPPEAELVNISEIVSEAIATLPANISHKNIKIRMQELPTLMVNRRQMIQLFQHLMSYTIRFKGQQDPEISIHWQAEEKVYRFSFQDNSQSLSTKAKDIFAVGQHLSNPNDIEAVGVGLAISKKIIEQHGGQIWLSPTSEGGNTFVFTLPR